MKNLDGLMTQINDAIWDKSLTLEEQHEVIREIREHVNSAEEALGAEPDEILVPVGNEEIAAMRQARIDAVSNTVNNEQENTEK